MILEPGVHIYPHADGLSWGVSVNCGLVVPDGCYLTVAGETRFHKERQLLVFNDGFVHSAGNPSGMPRVLFNAMCANPGFTRKEPMALRIVTQTLNSKL
jgi:aspartyl/asparaginyl beta-hydroxylase (cupin superfamily)